MFSRLTKIIWFSLLAHVCAGLALWSMSQDFVALPQSDPVVIETTILPPPPPVATSQPKAPPAVTPKPIIKADQPHKSTRQSGTIASTEHKSDAGNAGQGGQDSAGKVDESGTTAQTVASGAKLIKGVPVDVSIKDGGFKIRYDVSAAYKNIDAGGGATFTFNRQGSNYTAVLSSKASVASFNATSQGEIRNNTVVTTRFRDGGSISILGFEKKRFGSDFEVDYAGQQVRLGKEIQPLAYDAVYDYLSAMVYIQALLQSRQGKVASLQLPIGKRRSIDMATVSFEGSEDLSTYEGKFDALKASIAIPSGSIKSIQVWFVAEKNYRPLRIDLGLDNGKVSLISRESN